MIRRILTLKGWRRWLMRGVWGAIALMFTLSLSAGLGHQPSAALAHPPVLLQLPNLSGGSSSSSSDSSAVGWISLDGRQVFQVAAPQSTLSERQQRIEENLTQIRDAYLQSNNPNLNIVVNQSGGNNLPSLYVNDTYLMTITERDAQMQGTVPWALSRDLEETLRQALERSRQHRQPEYLRRQGIRAGIVLLVAIAIVWALGHWRERPLRWGMRALSATPRLDSLSEEQRRNLRDMQLRLIPIVQGLILAGVVIWSIGLFPQTRALQNTLIPILKIPTIILLVIIIAYVGIRISYVLIDRFVSGLTTREGYDGDSRRLRLRISTISSVVKNIANFVWIGIGIFVALAIAGINFGFLLASFGLLGLALSLATQNLLEGAFKGFFIILEDQYAIGDVVQIDDDAGLVEKMNLRITQLRDAGGRLITIPMSDVTRVANYSLHWSRADLKIPVHYNADIENMLDLTRQVGQELQQDPDWQELILEEPKVLGVDDFGDSSITIRVWIKTQPMKQWDVAREYRRRFKLALRDTDTEIPFPQRDVWLHAADGLKLNLEGQLDQRSIQNGGDRDPNGSTHRQPTAKTDRQPRNVADGDEGEPDS
ncbi:MAG: mechanosensitive ion channel family protein [Synechococcales bacterium]|nr:mechanosensitive ion channel family protein [Synechococcales bacterium]